MKKILLFTTLALMFVACNTNSPEQARLVGVWSEPAGNATIKTLVFRSNGTLIYTDKPDSTVSPIIDWGGDYAELNYKVTKDQITVSGTRKESNKEVPFEYNTEYAVNRDTLTIKRFSHNGLNFYTVPQLIKQ